MCRVLSDTLSHRVDARGPYATCRMNSTGVRPPALDNEQTAARFLRNLSAELVAVKGGVFWVVVNAREDGPLEADVREAAAMVGLPGSRVRVIGASDASGADIKVLLRGAIVLAGESAWTIRGEPLRRMIDLHYDVPQEIRSLKDRVNRYVFGYRLYRKGPARPRSYRYRGIAHRKGVRWIGQSVLRLPPRIAEEVESTLRSWGVPVTREDVFETY